LFRLEFPPLTGGGGGEREIEKTKKKGKKPAQTHMKPTNEKTETFLGLTQYLKIRQHYLCCSQFLIQGKQKSRLMREREKKEHNHFSIQHHIDLPKYPIYSIL
jgi:hypothetical protein